MLVYPGPLGSPARAAQNAPPAFIVAGSSDKCCMPPALNLYQQLVAAGVSAELHLYADTDHAFNMGQRSERLSVWVATPLDVLQRIVYPITWVLQKSADAITRLFGVEPAPAGVYAHTEEDIRHIVAEAEDTGAIQEAEEEMVYKVFDFADKEVHEVMVPRPEVVALSIDLPPQECLAAIIDSPYTRYPVYRGSLDEILGLLHVRDLFSALYNEGIDNVSIE